MVLHKPRLYITSKMCTMLSFCCAVDMLDNIIVSFVAITTCDLKNLVISPMLWFGLPINLVVTLLAFLICGSACSTSSQPQ